MRLVAILLFMMAAARLAYAAGVEVATADGTLVVTVDASSVAAWHPTPGSLAVVAPVADVAVGTLPAGMQATALTQGPLRGVLLSGGDGAWSVVHGDGKWLLRKGPASATKVSAVLLKSVWQVGDAAGAPRTVTVDGVDWQVLPVATPVFAGDAVVGAARKASTVPAVAAKVEKPVVAKASSVERGVQHETAKVQHEVAAAVSGTKATAGGKVSGGVSATLTPVKMAAVLGYGGKGEAQASSGLTLPVLPDSPAKPSTVVRAAAPAKASKAQEDSGLVVAEHPASPLKAMPSPGAVSELLPMDLTDIYIPGTLVRVSWTMPIVRKTSAVEVIPKVSATAPVEVSSSMVASESAATAQLPVPESHEAPVAAMPDEEVTGGVVFPSADEESYGDTIANALQAAVEAPEGSARARRAELALAATYLAWQRPEEALAALATLPARKDGLPESPLARLYFGVAVLAEGKHPAAGTFDQGGPLQGDADLWRAVAASKAGDYGKAMKTWPSQRGVLPKYPGYLRQMAELAQMQALVAVGDKATAIEAVDSLAKAFGGNVPPALVRLQGLARLGTGKEKEGLDYLAKAAQNTTDPATAYRAKFEFVKTLQQRHDLSDAQVRKYLTDLWMDWRGDKLERDVLETLADLYDKVDEPRDALRMWQVLVTAYPNATNMGAVTDRMTSAFLKVFDPENPKSYDPLTYMGVYYDFKELVPNDARGDAVQEQVARLMGDKDLWDRAVPILQQQLDYRPLDPASQGRLVLMLADDLRHMQKQAEALKLLDKWQKVATTTLLARGWKIENARLLLELNRPEAARKALAGIHADDSDARDLRIEADWALHDWTELAGLLRDKLKSVSTDQMARDSGAQLALLRLAYTYGQLRDADAMDTAVRRYADALGNLPDLADGIGAVAAVTGLSTTLVTSGPLGQVTTAMTDLNAVAERMRATRNAILQDREKQRQYDDKMKYMDLLPPPAI